MPDESQVIKFLMKKYEIYMKGYEYRDKLVNDIFFRIIHVFQLFLLIIVISGELIEAATGRNSGYCIVCYIIIGFAGFFSMGSLFLTLLSLSSSKAEMRKQCVKLEAIISELYPIDAYLPKEKAEAPNLKYWNAVQNRKKYKWEDSIFVKGFEQKNTFRMKVALIIINIWILIVIIAIIKNPDIMPAMDFIKHHTLHLPPANNTINISL